MHSHPYTLFGPPERMIPFGFIAFTSSAVMRWLNNSEGKDQDREYVL